MQLWILVCILLVVAIVLFALSIYVKDDNVQDQLDEFTAQQSQEFYAMKTRLAELEKAAREQEVVKVEVPEQTGNHYVEAEAEPALEVNLDDVSDLTREEVIRLYSQGYTMHEISHHVALSQEIIQSIVDDYIENR
ncbi:hypothetical protein [uncultured Abiotrophia sp.]|jgi:hypothetical protein|uniref:hypothetical protein n=1 Tax=uncultured Abiotrophia sp. TaxID=316094 RepID=UPI0028E95DAA|nr:hypothetical protein [uncultured Abiotrophia sp.]